MADYVPEKVHLVGSIGLDSVEEIFRTVGTMFGRRLKRVPDGEPGPRRLWVTFQYPLLRSMETGYAVVPVVRGAFLLAKDLNRERIDIHGGIPQPVAVVLEPDALTSRLDQRIT
jgi:hypothetical protein